jgi:hypothetical protein
MGLRILILSLLPVPLAGQPWSSAVPVFPSDSLKPERMRDADLLSTVCPGRIALARKLFVEYLAGSSLIFIRGVLEMVVFGYNAEAFSVTQQRRCRSGYNRL